MAVVVMSKMDAQRKLEPHDRMTKLCNAGLEGARQSMHHREGDRVIVFAHSADGRGGIGIGGYEDNRDSDREAFADILVHIQAIAEANGFRLEILTL